MKHILLNKQLHVDGKRRKDEHDQVGLFDVIDFPEIDVRYRVTLNSQGKVDTLTIGKEESTSKPCKIIGKTKVKGKTQLNMSDGRNIFVDKDSFKTGDTLIIEVPSQEIKKHLKLDKGMTIFLTGGKYQGHLGKVECIFGQKLIYKTEDGQISETNKAYAFVVGETKPVLSVAKK